MIGIELCHNSTRITFVPYATTLVSGNIRFRSMVDQFKKQYEKCSRHEKTALAESLVRKWRAQSPPGRFLKMDESSGLWEDVGKEARRKCSQLLREGASKNKKDDISPRDPSTGVRPTPAGTPREANALCDSPQQRKSASGLKKELPGSVMDRAFFGMGEIEEKDATDDDSQCESVLSLPRLPGRLKRERAASCNNPPSLDSSVKDRTALGAFLTDMLREKAATLGAQDICILQDNASVSPTQPKTVFRDGDLASHVSVPLSKNCVDGAKHGGAPGDINHPVMAWPHQHPAKITPSKRNM